MKQDNFFDLKRFTHVLRNDFLEHKMMMFYFFISCYVFFTANIISLTINLYGPNATYDHLLADALSRNVWIFSQIYFFIYLLIFAAFNILSLSRKQKRINFFMLPATIFEKYLAIFLRTVGFYTLSFVVIFYLTDCSRMLFFAIFYPEAPIVEITSTYLGNNIYQSSFLLPYFTIISLQSIFILGAVSFYTTSFFKTLGGCFCAVGAFLLLTRFCIYILPGFSSFTDALRVLFEPMEQYMREVEYTDIIIAAWGFVILFALANWILAYYRLKESQIISKL